MNTAKVKHSYTTYKPTSMIPANGWQVVYAYRDEDDGKYAHAKPLIAFALTEVCRVDVYEGGQKRTSWEEVYIVGYDPGAVRIDPVEETVNFIGYVAPDMLIPDYMEQEAKEYVLANDLAGEPGAPNEEINNESP